MISMGKQDLPLVNIPVLSSKRIENNGRLLRRPHRQKLEPLQAYVSPPVTPDENDDPGNINYQEEARARTPHSVVLHAGQTTPFGPPPTEANGSPSKIGRARFHLEKRGVQFQIIPEEKTCNGKPEGIIEDVSYSPNNENLFPMTQDVQSRKHTAESLNRVLLRTQIHSGPQGLCPPPTRKPHTLVPFGMMQEKGPSEIEYSRMMNLGEQIPNDPALMVRNFMSKAALELNLTVQKVETVMCSRANFKRLTQLVHEQLTSRRKEHNNMITLKNLNRDIPTTDLPYRPSSHAVSGSRVPQQQILLQMASMLTEQIKANMEGANVRAIVRQLPKWCYDKPIGEQPRAEIILYEDVPNEMQQMMPLAIRGTEVGTTGMLIKHAHEKYFMDSRRNQSPFSLGGENGLTNTDIAVLDALITGGAVLSLKAHFIEVLPDISPIHKTLRYINLSFNNLTTVPPEVFLLSNLEVLKLRNNPITDIPDEIRHLKYLRTFEIPFCLVSTLPDGLFTLKQLQYLDLSYNKLCVLPDKVKRLRNLQVLFVEGNQLTALPSCCLSLPHLRYIRVRNNFMHSLFWPDITKDNDTPQRLQDLAGLLIKQAELESRYGDNLPDTAKLLLKQTKRCDCCHGPLVGTGLPLVRPGSLFGVRNVPFLFYSCSPYCAKLFMQNTESLTDLIYEDSDYVDND